MSKDTIDKVSQAEYETFHKYCKAFKSASVYGLGAKEIYGPEGDGDLAVSYGDMVDLLQILHSAAPWSCDMRKVLTRMIKKKIPKWNAADKFHGDGEYRNSLVCGDMCSVMLNLSVASQAIPCVVA